MSDFRGARGSNTGDDFHELWATRHAIRLLLNDDGFEALAVEGLAASDEGSAADETWDGVDCTLYFGGSNATTATRVVLEQLKYSAASPTTPWTVARLAGGKRRDKSVIARLAKAWKGLAKLRPGGSAPGAKLVSNQPVDPEITTAFARAAVGPLIPQQKRKPRSNAPDEEKLAFASGLTAEEFRAFAAATTFDCGAGSRFAIEEHVLRAIADWTDQDLQHVVTGLREYVRIRMRPELAQELITRESVVLHLGASESAALFPCPSEITLTKVPVTRAPVQEASRLLNSGIQYLCLHGGGGVGKTTALQEIEDDLPSGSIMVKYDCYGGGRYLDSSALRHRAADAFLQLTNELASRLQLPLLLSRRHSSDYPRLFATRLRHAASAVQAQGQNSLIVIAIDAADNSIIAAQSRIPQEQSFVHDFLGITDLPANVRFVVTARTGQLERLKPPRRYVRVEIRPFDRTETAENVRRVWDAPPDWTDDFHHFSGGVPRVQAYAFDVGSAEPATALDRLLPSGKSLDEIFGQIFASALAKNGGNTAVAKMCAALVALPRPVPLMDLAGVLGCSPAHAADICADLAPGIRIHDDLASFADEDFEHFVRSEGTPEVESIQEAAATWLLARAKLHRYAAQNVAAALVAARRGNELLELIEREPEPAAILDPVLRREAQVQRLRLAIRVCREAGDIARALRFVLIGAEGIKTESALYDLLVNNPDMAANFAQETAGRLILADSGHVENHGPQLFQRLSVDARHDDAIAVREGRRLLDAWMQLRRDRKESEEHHWRSWKISTSDVCAHIDAALRCGGVDEAVRTLAKLQPAQIALDVGLALPSRLIAEGRIDEVEAMVSGSHLGPVGKLLLLIPLAIAGYPADAEALERGLAALVRRRLWVERFFDGYQERQSTHALVLDLALAACEILTSRGQAVELVDRTLARFLSPKIRSISNRHLDESLKLDLLFRAYALSEVRQGRRPSAKEVFAARPADVGGRGRYSPSANDGHDRPLVELAGSLFGVYVAVANCLVNSGARGDLNGQFGPVVQGLTSEHSWITQRHGFRGLRECAARSTQVLLAAGCDSHQMQSLAIVIHGNWRSGNSIPDEQLVARMGLRQELHGTLIADLAAGANATRVMRIGADEKSRALVGYARLLLPISAPDANAVFNDAVEAASELDREVMAQIRLLDKLIARSASSLPNRRNVARRVAEIVADAAIRLEGQDHFPWEEAMSALARLDAPSALANAARWDDEGLCALRETLPPLLTRAMHETSLTPVQAAALALFVDRDQGVLVEALQLATSSGHPVQSALAEEAAHDELVPHSSPDSDAGGRLAVRSSPAGTWMAALHRQREFVSQLPPEPVQLRQDDPGLASNRKSLLEGYVWEQNVLSDRGQLQAAITALQEQARADHSYLHATDIMRAARLAVAPRDRIKHLSALAGLVDPVVYDETVKALMQAIEAWEGSPSVHTWCETQLPALIVSRLPAFARLLEYDQNNLTPVLRRTGLSDPMLQGLVLQGIEIHVDDFGSDRIFALAGLVGGDLTPADAADLTTWYAERLADRIAVADRDQAAPDDDIPRGSHEAVARFIFAYMGDYDVRVRWRAAHAVRRLARLGDTATLAEFAAQYARREDLAFRARDLAFYWLGARLWFVIAWDRVAGECPEIAASVGRVLLQIALDSDFPHLLVRSFALDACERLVTSGHLALSPAELGMLSLVNESQLPRLPSNGSCRREFDHSDAGRRFEFNWSDTLPYWYRPLLNAFADVSGERFLQAVEAWVIDKWGNAGNVRAFDKERRGERLNASNYSLTGHSHGSLPTLERLNTHLEWHGMWCAAGDLLRTEPLVAARTDGWDDWDRLSERVTRQKLSQPPLWSADLLTPIPLVSRNWRPDKRGLDQWSADVREADHREEMFPPDRTDYVVVDGHAERHAQDREETTRITSALVSPDTGGALLRALQTMDDAWDYKLPDEGEDHEIDRGPFRLIGWLRSESQDGGIDEKDPFRGYATHIKSLPGQRVTKACDLRRDEGFSPRWFKGTSQIPMFVYECWGEAAKDDERYTPEFSVSGERLLVHKQQLQDFLREQGLDLIVEVEVLRRGKGTRQFTGEKESTKQEGRYDRLYSLRAGGDLEVAEGRLGTWPGDRQ